MNKGLITYWDMILRLKDLHLVISDTGIASRIGNDVIINQDLFRYPEYVNKVIKHEIKHNNSPTIKDFLHDLNDTGFFDNLKFCLLHPKGFTHFIPFGKYNDRAYIDINMIGVYLVLAMFMIIFYFAVTWVFDLVGV